MAQGTPEARQTIRRHVDETLEALRTERAPWVDMWGTLADHFLPVRHRWLISPNDPRRGTMLNGQMLSRTPPQAARTCASGIFSGTASPARPWFKWRIPGLDIEDNQEVKLWLDHVERLTMDVLQASGYYAAKAQQIYDNTVFGTSPMMIYEDYQNVVRCYVPPCGQYFIKLSNRLEPDALYLEYAFTVSQLIQEFGLDACSETVKSMAGNSSGRQREVIVCQAIEPNDQDTGGRMVPKQFPFREVIWEYGTSMENVLRVRGYHEQPFSAPRWTTTGNDAYGYSPAMDALPDTKQLYLLTKRIAQGIDKMVNPPLKASVSIKNRPASSVPGALTYVDDMNNGIAPIYEVNPRVAEAQALSDGIKRDIRETFYNDLFLMISQLETVRTATEVEARREEKLVLLGPVLDRAYTEGADPELRRILNVMDRAGMLPPRPDELKGVPLEVEYVSMLAVAQRAASTAGMERLASFTGNIMAVNPEVGDGIDWDELIDAYGDALGVPGRALRSSEQIKRIRDQRAQAQSQQNALALTSEAVQGGKVLSETDVGGGLNALQMMLGGA